MEQARRPARAEPFIKAFGIKADVRQLADSFFIPRKKLKSMKKLKALTVAILGTTLIFAQNAYVHQVIFLNEGWYDFVNDTLQVPPSIGSYDPVQETYTEFATIPNADFASDVVVDDAIYVAADQWLIKYDKNTLHEIDRAHVPGIRKIAVWNDFLIVTRGEFMQTFDSYVHLYQKATLTLFNVLDTITGPKYSVEGITILNDSAYLAVSNSFVWGDEKGIIGIVDLNEWSYSGEVDLGFSARNADNMMTDGNLIYTLNNKDFSSSSISQFDPSNRSFSVIDNIAANSGCGTSTLANGHIYYMEYAVNQLARFSTSTLNIVDTLVNTTAYYGLIDDPIQQQLYATTTDFVSTGRAYVLGYNGEIRDSFDVGVSPGSIALDVRRSTHIVAAPGLDLRISPNPTDETITISSDKGFSKLTVRSLLGQEVLSHAEGYSVTLDLDGLPPGVYFVTAETEAESLTHRILKQ